jgi:hypothetical protein
MLFYSWRLDLMSSMHECIKYVFLVQKHVQYWRNTAWNKYGTQKVPTRAYQHFCVLKYSVMDETDTDI